MNISKYFKDVKRNENACDDELFETFKLHIKAEYRKFGGVEKLKPERNKEANSEEVTVSALSNKNSTAAKSVESTSKIQRGQKVDFFGHSEQSTRNETHVNPYKKSSSPRQTRINEYFQVQKRNKSAFLASPIQQRLEIDTKTPCHSKWVGSPKIAAKGIKKELPIKTTATNDYKEFDNVEFLSGMYKSNCVTAAVSQAQPQKQTNEKASSNTEPSYSPLDDEPSCLQNSRQARSIQNRNQRFSLLHDDL